MDQDCGRDYILSITSRCVRNGPWNDTTQLFLHPASPLGAFLRKRSLNWRNIGFEQQHSLSADFRHMNTKLKLCLQKGDDGPLLGVNSDNRSPQGPLPNLSKSTIMSLHSTRAPGLIESPNGAKLLRESFVAKM